MAPDQLPEMSISDAVSIALVLATVISFLPQYQLLFLRWNCNGISLSYLLFLCVSSTEQLTLLINHLVIKYGGDPMNTFDHLAASDWVNIAQLFAVWSLLTGLLLLCTLLPSNRPKDSALLLYLPFLGISLGPAIFQFHPAAPQVWRAWSAGADFAWGIGFFQGIHALLISPLVTFLTLASLFPQLLYLSPATSFRSFSVVSLGMQTMVYALAALNWTVRLAVQDGRPGLPSWEDAPVWYVEVGWAAVDSAVMAFVQLVLFFTCLDLLQRRQRRRIRVDAEYQPLLS